MHIKEGVVSNTSKPPERWAASPTCSPGLDAHTGVVLRTITVGGFLGVGVMGAYPGVMADMRTGRIFVTDSEGVPGAMRTVVRVLDGRSGRVLRRIVGSGGVLAIAAHTGVWSSAKAPA
jgi:hypothetical protein